MLRVGAKLVHTRWSGVSLRAETIMNFTCSLSRVADIATIAPHGDLDLAGTAELRTALQSAAACEGITTIVVDLSGVTFMDTTALGVLVTARTAAHRQGAAFAVTNPGPMVTMILTLTGLVDTLVGSNRNQATVSAGVTE
jgi:anti-sigma B factor antagonist